MVVDDSALYRKAISDVLSEHEDVEVVATAPNGKLALAKIPDKAPDIITLDMEMPEMDGLTTLQNLKQEHGHIKTIVFSHHTEKGAELTLKALNLGAVDFVTKPASGGRLEDNLKRIREELLPEVLEFSHSVGRSRRPTVIAPQRSLRPRPQIGPRDVIAIGVSTGGPTSLVSLFKQLPTSLKQSILIVQHMPAIFTRKLAEQLARVGTIPVTEARDGEPIEKGCAYVAPGDFHMEVIKEKETDKNLIHTFKGPAENYCRPSVDVLFRSVAEAYGQRSVGIIMTGMGYDGHKGAIAMHAAGAPIIAQDEATSVVWGMPRFIVEDNLADDVAPLDQIFQSIKVFTL